MIAFITGASRGIGKAIAKCFEEHGVQIICPTHAEMDLASEASIDQYFLSNPNLAPDIFIHCAGINKLAAIDEISTDLMKEVFQVNLFSAAKLMSNFTAKMKLMGQGKIVLISSLYSMITKERRIAYSSSKNALTGLMKTSALELAPYNILVNAVAPGYVMTDMTKKNLSTAEIKNIEEQIPTKRFQSAEDIATLVYFLCSEDNKSITGQLIAVDGGYTLR